MAKCRDYEKPLSFMRESLWMNCVRILKKESIVILKDARSVACNRKSLIAENFSCV